MKAEEFIKRAGDALVDRARFRDEGGKRSMDIAVHDFNADTGHKLCMSEGWHFMVTLKLARAKLGDFHMDDYVDAIGFMALEAEAAYAEAKKVSEIKA